MTDIEKIGALEAEIKRIRADLDAAQRSLMARDRMLDALDVQYLPPPRPSVLAERPRPGGTCPYCGGEDIDIETEQVDDAEYAVATRYYAACPACRANGPQTSSSESAREQFVAPRPLQPEAETTGLSHGGS